MADIDLARSSVRDLNAALHRLGMDTNETRSIRWRSGSRRR